MKKIFVTILSFILLNCSYERKERNFINWGAIIWKGEIVLTENHYIYTSDILSIEPGTIIHFSAPYSISIIIDGVFLCDGDSDNPVKFVNDFTNTYNTVVIRNNDNQNRIRWTSFSKGIELAISGFCNVSHSRIENLKIDGFSSSLIKDSLIGYLQVKDYAKPLIANCCFERQDLNKNIQIEGVAEVSITNCSIKGKYQGGLADTYVATVYSSGICILKKNWWNTTNHTYITNTLLFRENPSLVFYLPFLKNDPVNSILVP